jgi:trehalose/maltose hydrolase-like predicted phosphorylase
MYKDQKQKYTFSVNRSRNPYPMIAKKIRENYQQGDTVYYPSKFNNLLNSPQMAKLNVDVVDAQLVNLYFDSGDQYTQRIDLKLKDSVLIRGKNGRRLLIFDFDKGRFRY